MRRGILTIAVVGVIVLFGPPAQAGYIVTFNETGANVVASGSGTIDLGGLTFLTSGNNTVPQVAPPFATELTGAAGGVDEYQFRTISGPFSFGSGPITDATTGTGDLVGVEVGFRVNQFIFVPTGYTSGDNLSDTATYANESFATLGLTPGVYAYNFGSGADADTFTVDVASVPEPASLALFGAGLAVLGVMLHRRKAN